jgi:hypothetical protein
VVVVVYDISFDGVFVSRHKTFETAKTQRDTLALEWRENQRKAG